MFPSLLEVVLKSGGETVPSASDQMFQLLVLNRKEVKYNLMLNIMLIKGFQGYPLSVQEGSHVYSFDLRLSVLVIYQ